MRPGKDKALGLDAVAFSQIQRVVSVAILCANAQAHFIEISDHVCVVSRRVLPHIVDYVRAWCTVCVGHW